MKKILLASLLIILAYQFIPTQNTDKVYVDYVLDGDTFRSGDQRYRIAEIDAPEAAQKFGYESKSFLSHLIQNKEVRISVKSTDRYGRKIVLVYVNDESVSNIMVEKGMAWHYKKYSSDNHLKHLEEEARKHKLGLWKFEAINPYFFRKSQK